MLYVKLNENREPVEVAKNYDTIAKELGSQNIIIPSEDVFESNPDRYGYAGVPFSEMPEKIHGKSIVPDIPIKNQDGTYQRTWKYVDKVEVENIVDLDKSQMAMVMKVRRKAYLEKFADTISPLRWNSWTAEQQQEVTDWYQSVLDMPNDPAWPYTTFPSLPTPIK